MAPGWVDGLTWWHVYPLGFSGAEAHADHAHGVVHRLRHLATWLDYARDLGCRGLHLGPILASHSHGYDTTDHLRIDRRLGDEHDFESLVAGCRERGMRVLMEGVFHHVAHRHPLFQIALDSGPHPTGADEQAARWFRIDWADGVGRPRYETLPGHDDLVTLNHAEPEVVDYVVHVMDLWLSRGADGWWLDTAHAIPPAFWEQVIPRVRERHPDAWLVGEADGADVRALLDSTGLDSVTADTLREPLLRSLNEADLRILAGEVDALASYAPEHPPLTYAGTHHVTRLASALVDPGLFGHAVAALFALPGTPSVYYGDEQAFRGLVEPGPDGLDAVRPMFPENPGGLAPWGWPVYDMHRELIAMRARNPWLTRAQPSVVQAGGTALALRSAATDGGGRRLTALLNIGSEPVRFDVQWRNPLLEVQSAGVTDPDLGHVPGSAWRIITHD